MILTSYLKPLVTSKFSSYVENAHANVRTSDFVKPRDQDAWAPMLTPLVVTRDQIVSPDAPEVLFHSNIITISTAFDWNLDVNKKFCYSKASETEHIQVTERERHFTSQAVCPITLKAFELAVSVPNYFGSIG